MFNTSQNVLCSLDCQGTLLAHAEPPVTSTHRSLSALQTLVSQPVPVSSNALFLVQDHPPFSFDELHIMADFPMLLSIQIPLKGLSSLQGFNSISQFQVISKFHFCIKHSTSVFKSLLKILNRTLPSDTTIDHLPDRCSPIH